MDSARPRAAWRAADRPEGRPGSRFSAAEFARCFDHMLRVDAAFFHHFCARRAHAEVVESNDFSVEPNIFVPNLGHPSLDRDPFPAFVRQNLIAILRRLAVKSLK